MTTFLSLTVLLLPFSLIVFCVLNLIERTEDDEFVDRIGAGERLPDTDGELTQLFAAWVSECNAPTEPALEVKPS